MVRFGQGWGTSRHALAALTLASAVLLPACAGGPAANAQTRPDAAPYDQRADAQADLANALENAAAQDKRVLAVFGANWCHDSRALAGWLESAELASMVQPAFIVTYIDVGVPQEGKGRNLDLAARYGVTDIVGTPTLLVLEPDGTLLNTPEDARAWRNAESRGSAGIRADLEAYRR